jgi:hypothetical protein
MTAVAGCLVRVDVVDDFFDSIGHGLLLRNPHDRLDTKKVWAATAVK